MSVVEMSSACRLIFCSKTYCSINFGVSYCNCEENNRVTDTKEINLINTKEGTFCVDDEGQWVFIGAGHHKWKIEKCSNSDGENMESVDLGLISEKTGFEKKVKDCFYKIVPRVLLEKTNVIKRRQASLQLMGIHTPE